MQFYEFLTKIFVISYCLLYFLCMSKINNSYLKLNVILYKPKSCSLQLGGAHGAREHLSTLAVTD